MLTGQLLTGQMLTPLIKNRTNAHKIWFQQGKFVNMDMDVIWLITFTARCTIVQSTVLPSLCCTADVMWNAHWVETLHAPTASRRWSGGTRLTNSDNYVQVVIDAGAITSHFCSPLISPTMIWVDPVQQYSGDCDQVIVTACGSTSHVCASVPDYITTSCVRLSFCRTVC